MGKLDNKGAVVSGAARGQGRSHAVNLAAEGASIIALDICADLDGNTYPLARPEDLDETARLAEKEGVRVHTAIVDVRERAAVWKAIADGVEALGRLDVVVANAGICAMGKDQTIQSWSDTIDTDLVGVFNVIQASLPHINDGASIIATGSLAAQLGSATNQGPGGSAYSLAKQIVARYVNDLSIQLAKRMIRVNAVHPTNVNTDMLHNEGMYTVFRPDLKEPTREDAELSFPMMQAMPVPYIEPNSSSAETEPGRRIIFSSFNDPPTSALPRPSPRYPARNRP
ncbi:MAG: mycofactocin-coupled SDR family oxidoreductase, partial [Erythrobacter sp.]|nr:mycofactocin-coupled SDR family oxidoreductase [Erythrobacter sp.]